MSVEEMIEMIRAGQDDTTSISNSWPSSAPGEKRIAQCGYSTGAITIKIKQHQRCNASRM